MATESKQHTPTPWEFSGIRPSELKDGVLTIALDQPYDRYVVRHCHRDDEGRKVTQFVADVIITKGHEAETEGNGRLIAAAPEMLEALELDRIMQDGGPNPFGHNCAWCSRCYQKVTDIKMAAIRKAEAE